MARGRVSNAVSQTLEKHPHRPAFYQNRIVVQLDDLVIPESHRNSSQA
jgi:hypothetical protein